MTVLVTRPDGQADGLAHLINEAGGQAVLVPLLSIAPPLNPSTAKSLLNAAEPWDWLIFISANAVRGVLGVDGWMGPVAGATRLAAVGEATATALAEAGLTVDLVPYPQFNSEALLADPRMAQVAGQRVLIVRGEGGREHLAETLRERGADVAYAEVYRRVPVSIEAFSSSLNLWQEASFDAVVVTSGEALAHLTGLLRETGLDSQPRPVLVVPSERIANQAAEQGWPRILIAEQASDEGIVQAIKQLAHARKTGLGPLAVAPIEPASNPPESEIVIAPADAPIERQADNTEPDQDQDGDKPLTNEEKEIQSEEDPSTVQEPVTPDKVQPPKKSRSLAWVGYMVLSGVIALAAGGWFLLQELRSSQEGLGGQITDKTHQVQEVTHQISSVQSEIAALHSQVATLQSQLFGNDAKIERRLGDQVEQIEAKLSSTRGDLANAMQQIQRQLNRTRGDLLITDAEYLLSVANQKLNLVGDVKSVLAAMEAADQRLHESADPAAYKVREALAEEMAAVRKIQAPDLVGLSSQLIALEKKVPALPLLLPHAGTVKQHEKAKEEQQSKADEQGQEEQGDAFDSALRGFKDLVTVRRTDQPVEALLAPEQVEVLRQLLLLKLESSRAALLRNDEQLYRDSLATATDWIGQHFDTAAAETKSMLDALNSLADRSFSVAYPDISKSMIMLQNIEKLRLEAEEGVMRGKPQDEVKGTAAPASPEPAAVAPVPTPQVVEPPAGKDTNGKKSEKTAPGKKGKGIPKAESPMPEPSPEPPPVETSPANLSPAEAGPVPAAEPAKEATPEPPPDGSPVSESEPALPVAAPSPALPEAKPIDDSGERL
jgi:uroporphyrinogen-III synthase/uncharacterized protein HemX